MEAFARRLLVLRDPEVEFLIRDMVGGAGMGSVGMSGFVVPNKLAVMRALSLPVWEKELFFLGSVPVDTVWGRLLWWKEVVPGMRGEYLLVVKEDTFSLDVVRYIPLATSFSWYELARLRTILPINWISLGIYEGGRLLGSRGTFAFPVRLVDLEVPWYMFSVEVGVRGGRYVVCVVSGTHIQFVAWLLLFLVVGGLFPGRGRVVSALEEQIRRTIRTVLSGVVLLALVIMGIFGLWRIQIQLVYRELQRTLDNLSASLASASTYEMDWQPSFLSDYYVYDGLSGHLLSASSYGPVVRGLLSDRLPPWMVRALRGRGQVIGWRRIGRFPILEGYKVFTCSSYGVCILRIPYYKAFPELVGELFILLLGGAIIWFVFWIGSIWIARAVARRFLQPIHVLIGQIEAYRGGRFPARRITFPQELEQIHEALRSMARRIEKMIEYQRLIERLRGWREVARQIGHEINNALTPLKLRLQQWELQAGDRRIREGIRGLLQQVALLERLSQSLRSVARVVDIHLEPLDLCGLVRSWAKSVSVPSHIRFVVDIPMGSLWVRADSHAMLMILNNLFKNAIEAIPPGSSGWIRVQVVGRGRWAQVVVQDNGVGIPAEDLRRIFFPTFSTKSHGRGIGLALVYDFVSQMHGQIQIRSAVGRGTRVVVWLPRMSGEEGVRVSSSGGGVAHRAGGIHSEGSGVGEPGD